MRKGSACELVVGHEHRPAPGAARNIAVHAEVPEWRQAGRGDPHEPEAASGDDAPPVERRRDKPEDKLNYEAHGHADRDLEPGPE